MLYSPSVTALGGTVALGTTEALLSTETLLAGVALLTTVALLAVSLLAAVWSSVASLLATETSLTTVTGRTETALSAEARLGTVTTLSTVAAGVELTSVRVSVATNVHAAHAVETEGVRVINVWASGESKGEERGWCQWKVLGEWRYMWVLRGHCPDTHPAGGRELAMLTRMRRPSSSCSLRAAMAASASCWVP